MLRAQLPRQAPGPPVPAPPPGQPLRRGSGPRRAEFRPPVPGPRRAGLPPPVPGPRSCVVFANRPRVPGPRRAELQLRAPGPP
eukprot:11407017-Alexandrium_andersonii.AAC.1